MELKLQLPDENTPGILLFLRQLALFQKVLSNTADASIEEIDEAYDFLLTLVIEPENRKKAKDALMGLSMAELGALFEGLNLQGDVDPKVEGS
jgi:hypothetical protein